jgi:hypothetical protein
VSGDGVATYAEDLRQRMLVDADSDGAESMLSQMFTRHVIDVLIEAGELEEAVECYHRDPALGIEASGYGIEDGDTLNLIATLHRGDAVPSRTSRRDVTTAFDRLTRLWERCRERPYHDRLEESSDAWDMALAIHRAASGVTRLRLFVVTDGLSDVEYLEPITVDDTEIRRSVWDISRLHRFDTSGQRGDPILIDFEERFGTPLPCLPAGAVSDDFSAYLSIFPGDALARIYDDFGPRLLELNVRSFLQATGKVNRGIRDTIAERPDRFLAYNNGISATASSVEIVKANGGLGIAKLRDFQIVNGGQTTASVHRAFRNGVDISRVAVQAKITVVQGGLLEEVVPLISRYANSQNKVSEADLRANDPFHVEVETLSRSIWAPATSGTMRQTRWFYERARGQYADAVNREGTPAKRKAFRDMNPTRQRFTKTDLAKFENTWGQLPHEVSKGAQKNFTSFMITLAQRSGFRPDVDYFHRLVAKAILFKRAERIVMAQGFGGYRANIVTYSLAKLSHATQQRIDLLSIWAAQTTDGPVDQAIEELSHAAFSLLTGSERQSANVTEWAKREACWTRMKELPFTPSPDLVQILVPLGRQTPDSTDSPAPSVDHPLIAQMSAVSADSWFAIANWAKQTQNLEPWQRRFAYSIGTYINRGRLLTIKQATQAERIFVEATRLGFRPEE